MIPNILKKLGIDDSAFLSIVGCSIGAVISPLAAFLIVRSFTPTEQGYYYTFGSLLALQVFLELGFAVCITQFSSHEFAKLKIDQSSELLGDPRSLSRAISIARFGIRWYRYLSFGLFVVLVLLGEMIFGSRDDGLNWRPAWWLLSIGTSMNILCLPFIAFLDGCDQMAWTARARIWQNTIRGLVLLFMINAGAALYAPALASLSGAVVVNAMILQKWKPLLNQIHSTVTEFVVSWKGEIWPLQWRISTSWISGYLIFSSFVPILFSRVGPKEAGSFGLTWTLIQGISSICLVLISTKQPILGALAAKQDWVQAAEIWKRTTRRVMFAAILLSLTLLLFAEFLSQNALLRERILPFSSLLPLLMATIPSCYTASVAILARAEKKEPFMVGSVVIGILIISGNLLFAESYGAYGIGWNYFFCVVLGSIWAYRIRCKVSTFRLSSV